MDQRDAKQLELRLKAYRTLETRYKELRKAMEQLTTNRPDDPNMTGPFTGNMMESRQIDSIDISFTATRGGSPPCEMSLHDLGIEAYEFKNHMMTLLGDKLNEVQKEMEKT